MKLLYICTYRFCIKGDTAYTIAAYGNDFWNQYSDVFDEIDVVGEAFKDGVDETQLQPITRKDVHVRIVPAMQRPVEFFNNSKVKKELEPIIRDSDCILIKAICRKANLAIKLAKKYNKPYMIGITGDLYRTLHTSKSLLRRMYAPIIYRQSLNAMKDCKYGTYVTQEYLQSVYPISGKMCGFTDTIIPYIDEEVLKKRISKIRNLSNKSEILLGVIGAYHTNNKGHDTIIKVMEKLNDPRISLHILGAGVEEDRERWFEYGRMHNVTNIVFDKPVSGVENVFKWIDEIDICLLPSRSEGLPRSIIEAISRACPCIASNVCGIPELLNSQWLHNPEDADRLACQIKRMIENPSIMEEAARENFEHSKSYSLEYITKKRNAFFTEFKEYAQQLNSIKK